MALAESASGGGVGLTDVVDVVGLKEGVDGVVLTEDVDGKETGENIQAFLLDAVSDQTDGNYSMGQIETVLGSPAVQLKIKEAEKRGFNSINFQKILSTVLVLLVVVAFSVTPSMAGEANSSFDPFGTAVAEASSLPSDYLSRSSKKIYNEPSKIDSLGIERSQNPSKEELVKQKDDLVEESFDEFAARMEGEGKTSEEILAAIAVKRKEIKEKMVNLTERVDFIIAKLVKDGLIVSDEMTFLEKVISAQEFLKKRLVTVKARLARTEANIKRLDAENRRYLKEFDEWLATLVASAQ